MDRPRQLRPDPAGRSASVLTDELIQMQITAARIACERMTEPSLMILRHAVEHASSLPRKPRWPRKAAAHAKIFALLADMSHDQAPDAFGASNGFIGEMIRAIGPAADGMLTSSHRRLLRHLAARDANGAELEVERLLRALHLMWRLASSGRVASRDGAAQ